MLTDIYFWQENEITQKVLRELGEEQDKVRERLLNGVLTNNPELEREYCKAIGYLGGLKYLERLIREIKDETRESS